jgi:hypothetical protein
MVEKAPPKLKRRPIGNVWNKTLQDSKMKLKWQSIERSLSLITIYGEIQDIFLSPLKQSKWQSYVSWKHLMFIDLFQVLLNVKILIVHKYVTNSLVIPLSIAFQQISCYKFKVLPLC